MKIGRLLIMAAIALLAVATLNAQPFAPSQGKQGSIGYVTGGIGADEAQALRDASADYPLTLELAAAAGGPRDEYISNAQVRIIDAQGALILDARTEGPLMLVQLPAGTYAVDVEWNGMHKQKTVEIGQRRQHLMLEFPGSLDVR